MINVYIDALFVQHIVIERVEVYSIQPLHLWRTIEFFVVGAIGRLVLTPCFEITVGQ
jgi:hypothetical protein